MKHLIKILSIVFFAVAVSHTAFAQRYLPINTGAGYLGISPDARSSSLGNIGAATSPDATSQYWNSSKYVFANKKIGASLSYVPWMRNVVDDMNLLYLSGYYKLDEMQAFSASVDFMSYGEAYFRNDFSELQRSGNINDFSIDFGYSRKLFSGFSAGVVFRYIRAASGAYQNKVEYGNAFAVDVNAYYNTNVNILSSQDELAFGINFSNVGTKLKGSDSNDKYFLPANLRLGGRLTTVVSNDHRFSLVADINKLMVPTPVRNSDGSINTYMNKSPLEAVLYSFGDNSFSEELKEITWATGLEYSYLKTFSLRAGYFHETARGGDRSFIGFGAGYRYRMVTLDLSYTVAAKNSNSTVGDIFRVSLGVNF